MKVRELNSNGAWSWFMGERCLVSGGHILVGSVRSTPLGREEGRGEPGWGNIELAVWDPETDACGVVVLHEGLEQDDHNAPGLLALADGRLVATYTKHSQERRMYARTSPSGDPLVWEPVTIFDSPGVDHPPYGGDNVTYSNLFEVPGGRILNFARCVGHQWSWLFSDDAGKTWHYGGMFLRGRAGYAPYFKFAARGDSIHFIATEDHPREYDNSVYHGFLRDGMIFQSDGCPLRALSHTTAASGDLTELTRVFAGDPDNVAWVTDLRVDARGCPVCVFTVQKDGRGLPRGQGGLDHRFHHARWNGSRWLVHEMAHAGSRLYPWEDDYTGLAAIDPFMTGHVLLSTDADPHTGAPLVSKADGLRHHELFQGINRDGEMTWQWTPLTRDSRADNLRPIVPVWADERVALVWMQGLYEHNTGPWNTKVVGAILPRPQVERQMGL